MNTGYLKIQACTGAGSASEWTPTGTIYNITPQALKVSGESVASPDSGRDLSGGMHVTYLKPNLRKIEVTLPPYALSDTTYNAIINLVQGKVCQYTFYDPFTLAEKTCKMYCSSTSADFYSGIILNGIVQDVTFNAIEME